MLHARGQGSTRLGPLQYCGMSVPPLYAFYRPHTFALNFFKVCQHVSIVPEDVAYISVPYGDSVNKGLDE